MCVFFLLVMSMIVFVLLVINGFCVFCRICQFCRVKIFVENCVFFGRT